MSAAPIDLGTVLTGAMVLAGVVYTAYQGRRATREANKLAGRNADVEGLQRLSQEQRAELIRLEGLRQKDAERIGLLERTVRNQQDRIEHLEEKDRDHRRKLRAAFRYIRELLSHIRHHAPAPPAPPPPPLPVDLHADLDGLS